MRIWAIVPVKPFVRAKSRLAPALTAEQRQRLSQYMLARVLAALTSHPALAGTVVVSRDPASLDSRFTRGVPILPELGQDLNTALRQATEWARAQQADAVLVLPADVPLVQPEDITAIAGLAQEEHCVVLAACRRADGTNALLVRPAGAIDYAFGPGSFNRHSRRAQARGLAVHVYCSPTLALDIDRPEDLAEYARLSGMEPGEILTSVDLSSTILFNHSH